jgi:exodeoxyribonuclease VIII
MKPTIIYDMPASEYHAAEGLSKSGLDKFKRSPMHYKHWLTEKPEPTEAMRIGSLVHMAVFEPIRFTGSTAVAPIVDRRTKDGKLAYEMFTKENAGKEIISADDVLMIKDIVSAINNHRAASKLLKTGQAEVSVFAKCPITDILCKGRFDFITDDCIVDLKTTEDASPAQFGVSVMRYRYMTQAAHYLFLADQIGLKINKFIFIAVEKEAPHGVGVYEVTKDQLLKTDAERITQLRMFKNCSDFDSWPTYGSDIQPLQIPNWASAQS